MDRAACFRNATKNCRFDIAMHNAAVMCVLQADAAWRKYSLPDSKARQYSNRQGAWVLRQAIDLLRVLLCNAASPTVILLDGIASPCMPVRRSPFLPLRSDRAEVHVSDPGWQPLSLRAQSALITHRTA